jgi:uncharacterized membrane protein
MPTSAVSVQRPSPAASVTTAGSQAQQHARIGAIDVMRGLVMLLMLIDHVRETFYLHLQVSDPMNVSATEPALFFTRLAAHLCAPTFVFLTGLGAWLYANPPGAPPRSPAGFLFKRGLLLVVLELTLVSFAWVGIFPMKTLYLQVIWVIGLSMIVLAALCRLPLRWLAAAGLSIVFGHNLLTPIAFTPAEAGYSLWTILHDRGFLVAEGALKIKVSYPLLPWIGVILLGFAAGPLYGPATTSGHRRAMLLRLGVGCLALLLVLRGLNLYGETLPWVPGHDVTHTLMSWLNFTKYPPSLDFLLLTLGIALLLLRVFETVHNGLTEAIRCYGGAPMFYYLLHLYVLLVLQELAVTWVGANQGDRFGFDHVAWIWVTAVLLLLLLYVPTRAFARYKRVSRQAWVRYL